MTQVKLGQILVRKKLISFSQLEQILTFQSSSSQKLGELLVTQRLIGEEDLQLAMKEQYWRHNGFWVIDADSVVFANGSEFRATNPNTPPLLIINIPVGLGFRENPGRVVNRSFASVVEVDETGEEFETFIGLQVPPEQTLALIGGEVSLEGGILTTFGGRVELGSVAGNSFVSLTPVPEGFALSYDGVQNFQDISLSNFALVDTRINVYLLDRITSRS
ncbi:MAG: hypothetical protein WBB43_18845 [Limnoraphis sp.]